MKNRIFGIGALACAAIIGMAMMAADLSGKWTGILNTPDGNTFPLSYTFKLEDGKLTGTASTPQGPAAFTDGKVKDNDFSFMVDVNGTAVKNTCKYYPSGDTVSLNLDYNGFIMHSTLKRDTK